MKKERAQEIANNYAKKNGYETAGFWKDSYFLDGFIDCFVFYLTEKDNDKIQYVGLPEMLFVEKVSGTVFIRRELV